MTWDARTHDFQEYEKHARDVDYWMLAMAAAEGGTSAFEVSRKLFAVGIGDAERDTQRVLAYSSTGVIVRTAVATLRKQGLLESWMTTPIGRIKISPAGLVKLESMKGTA